MRVAVNEKLDLWITGTTITTYAQLAHETTAAEKSLVDSPNHLEKHLQLSSSSNCIQPCQTMSLPLLYRAKARCYMRRHHRRCVCMCSRNMRVAQHNLDVVPEWECVGR